MRRHEFIEITGADNPLPWIMAVRRRERRPGRPPRWQGGPAWQQARRAALVAGS